MSVTGSYTLLLSCDYPGCKELELQIVRATRMEAKEVARQAGWYLPMKARRILCPAHREERMERSA